MELLAYMADKIVAQNMCIIEGCSLKVARSTVDMCQKHWGRWKNHADPFWKDHIKIVKPVGKTLEERFWSKVDKNGAIQPHMDTPCWLWTGAPSQRYGQFAFEGQQYAPHRLSWELVNGKMDKDLFACHKCDIPRCVRPDHIFAGTCLENTHDKIAKGRSYYPGAKNPTRGERVNTAKLSEDDIRDIRKRRDNGEELMPIALHYQITRTQVSRIGLRQQWKHVKE